MLYFYKLMCALTSFELVLALHAGSNPELIQQLRRDLDKWERELHTELLSRHALRQNSTSYTRAVRPE